MSELVYRQPCEVCDGKGEYRVQATRGPLETDLLSCSVCDGSGGVERVLDPDKFLAHKFGADDHAECTTVADVLAVLDREEI